VDSGAAQARALRDDHAVRLRSELSSQIAAQSSSLQAELAQLKREFRAVLPRLNSIVGDAPLPAPVRPLPAPARLETRLAGKFRVRHIASGRFLGLMTSRVDDLESGLEFDPVGEVFRAETDSDWTRVSSVNGLVWFVRYNRPGSEFGLKKPSFQGPFCEFQFRDRYIGDHQVESRVMTVSQDWRAYFKIEASTPTPDQQFEIVVES
jgi:hypothetical protein